MKKQLWGKITAGTMAVLLVGSCVLSDINAGDGELTSRYNLETTDYDVTNSSVVLGTEETVKLSSGETGRETNFNEGWKFYLGTSSTAQHTNFDDSSWEEITIPHDFSISQNYTTSGEAESGFLPGGTGWYRKAFVLAEKDAGKNIVVEFDGVYSDAYVYVNGNYVGEHHYGYTNFAFDITDYVTCDGATENVIAVKAVNNIPSSRWYSGSGIYRDVTLIVTEPVHVDYNGTYVTTPNISSGNGTVNVAVDIVNDGTEAASVTVTNTVYREDSDTSVASATATVSAVAGATTTVSSANPVVSEPSLWSTDNPNLYVVRTELSVNDEVVDSYDTTFGFRWFSFDSTGFYLNGENVKLNGVCMHHDQGALGSAAYYDAMHRQLSILKEMGCNAIRTAHNPADADYIEICNELGLLVIEEAFDGWIEAKNGNSYDFSTYFETTLSSANGVYGGNSSMTWAEFAIKSIIKRDRNNPCIIAWSLGNEVQEGTYWTRISEYPQVAANLIGWIQQLDTTRPATSGDNNRGGNSNLVSVISNITNSGGVAGFNYANTASELYSLVQSYGGANGVIIASETASATNSRGIYTSQNNNSNADGKFHLTSYDTSSVSWGITAHDSIYNTYQYDCVAGEFVWTGFDYLGEPTPWNGTDAGSKSGYGAYPNSSYFGIVETTGFEKDTYYLYRSQWNQDETTLHLVTAWDSDNMMTSGGKTPVWVYSNAPVVKLYRDNTLVGTATREAHTSAAGHTYYTYTTESSDSSICTTSSGSGADGLYAVFNVAYTSGTLRAEAYKADGTTKIDLDEKCGQYEVSTPDVASKLEITPSTTKIDADNSSLVYIEVDVKDANGNLDTTATNTINFTVEGNGEILGVDNGDQATTAKYQQSSVLTSKTTAKIAAYAGKALVIVKSTDVAGTFTVNVSSSGLTGGSVKVTTTAVEEVTEGLVSYSIVRDYSVKVGTAPTLQTTATGTMADGTTVSGTVVWDSISDDIYNTAGDYTVQGTLTFEGEEPITVSARLHVIENVIAMRNVSTVTMPGIIPTLSSTVVGVMADGTLAGEFAVTWDTMTEDMFATVDDIVVINGTATVIGTETLPVTASIRVVEAVSTSSTNVAPIALTLTQDIAAANQSDVLNSIINGTTKPGDNTSERWTNWGNRTTSAESTLTFTWATAQLLSSVNLYYYYDNCCAYPESIEFAYSLDGENFTPIEVTATQVETYSLGTQYSYTFAEVINPVALRIKLTQQNGTSGSNCVGLTEVEIMTFQGKVEYNTSADLSNIAVDGTFVESFSADTLSYETSGSTVTATTDVNAGITILPVYEGIVRILTVSEEGSVAKTYEVTLTSKCEHANTELQNAKEATCTEEGYTGDTYCIDCETTIAVGSAIKATGHSYDDGVLDENNIITYTCAVCGDSYTKTQFLIPSTTIAASKALSDMKIKFTGKFADYDNEDKYYKVIEHGIVYIAKARLGSRNLTINTAGRTKVSFKNYKADGSFSYTMTPTSASTYYAVRSYLIYKDEDGVAHYVYSAPLVIRYRELTE